MIFKLKSIINGTMNPSENGLFSYGTYNVSDGAFRLFPYYGEDGTGGIPQKGWTFVTGQENYPFVAFEQLNANQVTPQPFPPFGIFVHPSDFGNSANGSSFGEPVVIQMQIPSNGTINYINSNIQRPSFGCGSNVGYTITKNNTPLLNRTIINTSDTPTAYNINSNSVNQNDIIAFIVDKGDDGNNFCDDTALDVEVSLTITNIQKPVLQTSLNCNSTTARFTIDFQDAGTLFLYKQGNPTAIASTPILQIPNTFQGEANFSGLNLLAGGTYFAIAKNAGQTDSVASDNIVITPCNSATLVDDINTTPMNTPVSGDVKPNDTVICSGAKTYRIKTGTEVNGSFSIDSVTGIYSFTPTNNFIGIATAKYEVLCDGIVLDEANITITVTCVNVSGGIINGNQNVTIDSIENYNVSGLSGTTPYTYTWTVTNGTIQSGQGTSTIVVKWNGSNSGNVQVVVNNCGNVGAVSLNKSIHYTNCIGKVNVKLNCGIPPYSISSKDDATNADVSITNNLSSTPANILFNVPNDGLSHNYTITINDSTPKFITTVKVLNFKCN